MSNSSSYEERLLRPVRELLSRKVKTLPLRLQEEGYYQILEATAARIGGFENSLFYESEIRGRHNLSFDEAEAAEEVSQVLCKLPMQAALALSSLAIPVLGRQAKRLAGAYHTDFRLADRVASRIKWDWQRGVPLIIDPSAGTGILLIAAVLALAGDNQEKRNAILERGIIGADISKQSLRGCFLALASLTSSQPVLCSLRRNLLLQDSLLGGLENWVQNKIKAADFVLGNPPWEKLKISRHEFLLERGVIRHYGQSYNSLPALDALINAKLQRQSYATMLKSLYSLQQGEKDTYMFFLELAFRLACCDGGTIILILPAGLLHSNGTAKLRKHIFDHCGSLGVDLFFNHANFFAVDSRTKFIILSAKRNGGRRVSMQLNHCDWDGTRVTEKNRVQIRLKDLRNLRPDLSVPEVRTTEEWNLFKKLVLRGRAINSLEGAMRPELMRELDMTSDRSMFKISPGRGRIPVIEGRMVHQYRHNCKQYMGGSGRRAVWQVIPNGVPDIRPQFWINRSELPEHVLLRVASMRLGFCDIAGQTNERTMLAAEIPSDAVCGNKVPTICFPRAPKHMQARVRLFWLGVLNSLTFDWLLRRICTTTVNYHLLLSLPFPSNVDLDSEDVLLISRLSGSISQAGLIGEKQHLMAISEEGEKRAKLDIAVAKMYGLQGNDLEIVVKDFPLLDRGQPLLRGDERSFVTRDLLLLHWFSSQRTKNNFNKIGLLRKRVDAYKALGAMPYVPSHLRNDDLEYK